MDKVRAGVLGVGLVLGAVFLPVVSASGAQQKPGASSVLKPQQPPSSLAVPMTTDIAITDLRADTGTCRIWVTWTNKGSRKIDAVLKERVEIHTNPILQVENANHVVLEPGASFSHGAGADPDGLRIHGAQEVLAWIDSGNNLTESNEANNAVTKTLTCGRTQPDLIPSTITFTTKSTYTDSQGHACKVLTLKPIIINIGTAPTAKAFTVKLEADTGAGRSWLAYHEYPVAGLAEGATLTLADFEIDTCYWFLHNPQMLPNDARRFQLTVDSKGDIPESREDNNQAIVAY